jgi:putative spermidine/putrescine transport system substrate-binding protein
MRSTIPIKLFGALFAVLMLSLAPQVHAEEVVLATWGGSWGKAIKAAQADPFEKETGIKVKMISGVSLANMQMIKAQRDNPQVDIVMFTVQDAVRAYNDGLLAPLDPKAVTNLKDSLDLGIRRDSSGKPMFAGMWMYPYGILYRTDLVGWDLDEWNDLWDPRLNNKVAVSSPKYMSAYFLLMINRIAGGTESNLDPGFDKIKNMGKNLLAVADDSATQQRMLAQGEVWAVPMLSGSAYKVIDQGVPAKFVLPTEGAPVGADVIARVKGGPNPDAANKFINYYIGAESLSRVTAALKVTPLNKNSKISPAHAKYAVKEADLARLLTFSEDAIINDRNAWLERWEREISPMTTR